MLSKGDVQLSKTSDVLSVSLAYGFIFLLSLSTGWIFFSPKYSDMTKSEALINAYQIWELEKRAEERLEKTPIEERRVLMRDLAGSVLIKKQGKISIDHWNRPYNYQIRNLEDRKNKIIVWSNGPDGKNNSDESLPRLEGDDIGNELVINP